MKHIFFIQDFSKKDHYHHYYGTVSKSRILGSSPDEMRYYEVEMPHFIKVTYL